MEDIFSKKPNEIELLKVVHELKNEVDILKLVSNILLKILSKLIKKMKN